MIHRLQQESFASGSRVSDWVFVKHEWATFKKVKNKKFVKTWKKANVQRVLGTRDWIFRIYHFCGEHKTGERKDASGEWIPRLQISEGNLTIYSLTKYFRALIPAYAKLAGKQTKLLTKETGWGGGDLPSDALEAFKCLREKLTQVPILAFPQSGVPFTLVTDASLKHGYGGGVLLQYQNVRNRVIAYFFRELSHLPL